ncbi:glutathione peroxidase 3-like isoform X2 [Cinclus cinclus]|uniref:glutathione peroxidase 3-like isoform X2 n=1 Tax=Cinclus cinclus TaxID=127875 RepID=UPI002E112DF7
MGGCSRSNWILPLFLAGLVQLGRSEEAKKVDCYHSVKGTIYSYGAMTLDGDEYTPFQRYSGKTVLFVNVASFCEQTLQYKELNALQDELRNQGVVVLGFPSNQFGNLEPGKDSEILPTLKYVRPGNGFVPNFQLFQKRDVNGAKEQKIFTFLKNACPPVGEDFGNPNKLFWDPLRNHDIKWNFEKFLVSPEGVPIMRWHHRTSIPEVKNDIVEYLRKTPRKPFVIAGSPMMNANNREHLNHEEVENHGEQPEATAAEP